jgi:hypothetical protein
LKHDADLSWRTARPEHYEADHEEIAEFQETFKKALTTDRGRLDDRHRRSTPQAGRDNPPQRLVSDWV